MSKQLLAGVAGAAIGFLIAGPAGIGIGWTIGALIGAILWPPEQEGPRLDDLTVQISEYGAVIRRTWGWNRATCNVVWATDLIEEKETSQEKSMGPVITEYHYFGNFTLLVCDGPISAVKCIKADGNKILWSAAGTEEDEDGNVIEVTDPNRVFYATQGAGGWLGASGYPQTEYSQYITIRWGTEDQLPSALHEQYDGVGEAPGYRGVGTIDFAALPLEEFGNRFPNITVEYFCGDADFRQRTIRFDEPTPDNEVGELYWYYGIVGPVNMVDRWIAQPIQKGTGIVEGATTENFYLAILDMTTFEETARFDISGPAGLPILTYLSGIPVPDTPYVMLEAEYWDADPDASGWATNVLVDTDTGDQFLLDNLDVGRFTTDPGEEDEKRNFVWWHFAQPLGGSEDDLQLLVGVLGIDGGFSTPSEVTNPINHSMLAIATLNPATGAMAWVGYGDIGHEKKYITDGGTPGDLTAVGDSFPSCTIKGKSDPVDGNTLFYSHRWPEGKERGKLFRVDITSAGAHSYTQIATFGDPTANSDAGTHIVDSGVYDPRNDWLFIVYCAVDNATGVKSSGKLAKLNPDTGAIISEIDWDPYIRFDFGWYWNWSITANKQEGFALPGYAFMSDDDSTGGRGDTGLNWYLFNMDTMTKEDFFMQADFDLYTVDPSTEMDFYSGAQWGIPDQQENGMWSPSHAYGIDTGGGDSGEWDEWSLLTGNEVPDGVSLYTIVRDVCVFCKLVESDHFNASALTDIVTGYTVERQITGRQIIEPLIPVYFFEGIETDWILKWQYRDKPVTMTVSELDLGTREEGGEHIPKLIETRTQEIELPKKVTVKYPDRALDYQPNTQYEMRHSETQFSFQEVTIDSGVVMDDDKAKDVAIKNLWMAWQMRTSYEISLPRKYAKLDPGDIIRVPSGDVTVELYINEIDRGLGGRMQIRGSAIDEVVYDTSEDTDGNGVSLPPIPVPDVFPMFVEFIDPPLIYDEMDELNIFFTVGGPTEGETWPGGLLYRSDDGGSSYSRVSRIPEEAPLGTLSSGGDLPGQVSHTYLDQTTVIRVGFFNSDHSLASCTYRQLMNGRNQILIGDEIMGFMTAVQINATQWEISNLRRGMYGTEWAMTTHAFGERVVVLDLTTWSIVPIGAASVGLERLYKAATIGEDLTDVDEEPFTAFTNYKKPLAPAHFYGTRDGSDNIDLEWIRRARVNPEWHDNVDAELDEPIERYQINVYNGVDIVRTQVVNDATTWQYTAVDQTTDFGSPQDPVTIGVRQRSSRVGWGYETVKSI